MINDIVEYITKTTYDSWIHIKFKKKSRKMVGYVSTERPVINGFVVYIDFYYELNPRIKSYHTQGYRSSFMLGCPDIESVIKVLSIERVLKELCDG